MCCQLHHGPSVDRTCESGLRNRRSVICSEWNRSDRESSILPKDRRTPEVPESRGPISRTTTGVSGRSNRAIESTEVGPRLALLREQGRSRMRRGPERSQSLIEDRPNPGQAHKQPVRGGSMVEKRRSIGGTARRGCSDGLPAGVTETLGQDAWQGRPRSKKEGSRFSKHTLIERPELPGTCSSAS